MAPLLASLLPVEVTLRVSRVLPSQYLVRPHGELPFRTLVTHRERNQLRLVLVYPLPVHVLRLLLLLHPGDVVRVYKSKSSPVREVK